MFLWDLVPLVGQNTIKLLIQFVYDMFANSWTLSVAPVIAMGSGIMPVLKSPKYTNFREVSWK